MHQPKLPALSFHLSMNARNGKRTVEVSIGRMYLLRSSFQYCICNKHVLPIDEEVIMFLGIFLHIVDTIPPSGTKLVSTAGEEE